MYEELVKSLREHAEWDKAGIWVIPNTIIYDLRKAADAIESLDDIAQTYAETVQELKMKSQWIPVTEGMPKCEQEVLISTEKKLVGRDAYIDSIVTPAIYEDGTMRENDSVWRWEDIDWAGWDEEEDCGIIPEGWWENRHFNPDDVYNNPVDRKVVAWMPMPESYKPPEEETC